MCLVYSTIDSFPNICVSLGMKLFLVYLFPPSAVIESLAKKAQLPSDSDFVVAYQKVKFGINVLAKLGHHLQSPSVPNLLEAFFKFITEFVKRNKR